MDKKKIMKNLRREEEEDYDSDHGEDAISLCNLSTDHSRESEYDDRYYTDALQLDRDSEYEEFCFSNPLQNDAAFLGDDNNSNNCDNAINFCGKIIGYTNADNNNNKRQDAVNKVENQRRLKNTTNSSSQSHRYRCLPGKSNSRKHVALIGLVKIPTEMDLSEIKRRQSRRRRNPVAFAGELAVAGGGRSERDGRRSSNRWGVRTLRCGARFANVFVKDAFSCFSFSLVRVYD